METRKSKLTPSTEDYLEAVYQLGKEIEGEGVRSTDVAQRLNVAKPSVNKALKGMADSGLLSHERYALIYLTDEGRKRAEEIAFRHDTIREFLTAVLKIEKETAEGEACQIEHAMSNETVLKMKLFMDNYKRAHKNNNPFV